MPKRKVEGPPISRLIQSVDEFAYFQKNWDRFIEMMILEPKSRVEGVDYFIDDPQRELIQSVNRYKRTTCSTFRGFGKTAAASWLALTFMSLYSYPKVAVTAPAGTQLNAALWPEIAKWLRNSYLEHYFYHTNDYIKYLYDPNSEWRTFRRTPKDESAASGLHQPDLLIIADEAAGINDEVLGAFDNTLTDDSHRNNKILLIGNPIRVDGLFADTHLKKHMRRSWHCLHFNAFESKRADLKHMEYLKQKYGEDSLKYKIEVLAEFPDANKRAFIPYVDVIEAQKRGISEEEPGRDSSGKLPFDLYKKVASETDVLELGLDCAGDGEDLNVCIGRYGNYVFMPSVMKYGESDQIYEMVITYLRELRNITGYKGEVRIKVDMGGGYGSGPYSYLANDRSNNVKPIKVKFNGVAKDEKEYHDVAVEMWDNVRYRIKSMFLPPDDYLATELYTREHHKEGFDKRGRQRIQSKKEFKKDYSGSPDRADALCLAFYDAPEDKKVIQTFDWLDKRIIRPIPNGGWQKVYTSMWYHGHDMKYFILNVGWNGNRMYVINEYITDDDLEQVSWYLSGFSKPDMYIGNKELFNRSAYDDLSYRLSRNGFYFIENTDYDESNASEFLSKMVKQNRIIINEECHELVNQLRGWTPEGASKDRHNEYGLCYTLSNIVSFLREKFYVHPKQVITGGYDSQRIEKKNLNVSGRDINNAYLSL